jgi:tRNA(Ile)-lysidine synthase
MGQHCLKKLFQEAGIPPWERQTRPLIYLNDQLAAVAGLWIADWAWSQAPQAGYQITWQPA